MATAFMPVGVPLAPLYLIHGEETLLALEAVDLIKQEAKRQGFVERTVLTVEAGFDWLSLTQVCRHLSLFATRKLIELRIVSGKPGAQGEKVLLDWALTLPEETVLIVVLPKVDQRSKWFQTLKKSATVIHAAAIDRAHLPVWVKLRLDPCGYRFTADAMAFFVARVEGNLLAARQVIDLLTLLYAPGELTLAALRKVMTDMARFDVFDLSEAWLGGERGRALRIVTALQEEGVAAVLVLWSLAEDIRLLLQLRHGLNTKHSIVELNRELKIWGNKQKLVEPACRRIGGKKLMFALEECAYIDQQIKGIMEGDPWEKFKVLIDILSA